MSPKPSGSVRGVLELVAEALNEAVMGFLALVALGIALAPLALSLSPGVESALDAAEWLIIAVFALDYLVTLILSPRPRVYALSFWGLLDLAIVVIPLASLLPWVSDELRSTPVLRLARLLRAAVFGTRAGGAVVRPAKATRAVLPPEPVRVSMITDKQDGPTQAEWGDFLRALLEGTDVWYHVSGGTAAQIHDLARVLGMPAEALDAIFGNATFPRAQGSTPFSTLFVWLPSMQSGRPASIKRTGILLLTNGLLTITLCPTQSAAQDILANSLPSRHASQNAFAMRTLMAVLKTILSCHEHVMDELESDLRALEALPLRDSTPSFFERSFWLKQELTSTKSDLWRLKGILHTLSTGRVVFAGFDSTRLVALNPLVDEVEYLYETVDNMREGVLALIDLHMNIVSFEINRFMRILAVVSVLGLIPAVTGGLLGMNVAGNPWEITLSEVTFGVSMGMLFCLWVFLVKGWLR